MEQEKHPNFYLWQIIQGMLNVYDLPKGERLCAWCSDEAVIMVPRDHWDDRSPLTTPACYYHGRMDMSEEASDGTSRLWREYLSYMEGQS